MDAVVSPWGCYLVTLGSLRGRKFKVGSWVWKWKSSGTGAMSSVYKLVGRIVNLGALLGLGRTYSIVIAKQELKTNGNWISPAEVLLHAGRARPDEFNVET